MVDSIRPTYRPVTSSSRTQRIKQTESLAPGSDEGTDQDKFTFIDRRRRRDRRRSMMQSRGKYDMRSGRGRRKSDRRFPNIETKV